MLDYTFSAERALKLAKGTAEQLKHNFVGSEHILCGLIEEENGVAAKVLKNAHIELANVESLISQFVTDSSKVKAAERGTYTPAAEAVLMQSREEAERLESDSIGTEHILIAMLKTQDCVATRILNTLGVNIQRLYNDILNIIGEDLPEVKEAINGVQQRVSSTPTLDKYSTDLTEKAYNGRLDPVIGRKSEIDRVIQILSRRTKNNPCLIGEPGVG